MPAAIAMYTTYWDVQRDGCRIYLSEKHYSDYNDTRYQKTYFIIITKFDGV